MIDRRRNRRRTLLLGAAGVGVIWLMSPFVVPSNTRTCNGPFVPRRARPEGLADPLFRIRLDGRYGFIDRSGIIRIPPKFENVGPFSEGLAPASMAGRWGFIDEAGTWIVQPQFGAATHFSDGMAIVSLTQSGQAGYVDRSGSVVILPRFDCVDPFIDGTARVGVKTLWSTLVSGFADVGINCSYSCMDKTGKNVVCSPASCGASAEYASAEQTNYPQPFNLGDKMGYADSHGTVVIEPNLDYAAPFENGLALYTTEKGRRFGYLDVTGRIVWPASE